MTSALEVIFRVKRSINPRFTHFYLLTLVQKIYQNLMIIFGEFSGRTSKRAQTTKVIKCKPVYDVCVKTQPGYQFRGRISSDGDDRTFRPPPNRTAVEDALPQSFIAKKWPFDCQRTTCKDQTPLAGFVSCGLVGSRTLTTNSYVETLSFIHFFISNG